jgi:hypothetical protein
MRKSHIVLIAIAALGVFAESASSEPSRYIGKHSPEAVMKACADAGGEPLLSRGVGYGCQKKDCDGKGGNCSVECYNSTGECYGSCPSCGQAQRRYDLQTILKYSSARPPRSGLLEPRQEASPYGPSSPGAPTPSTPPTGKLY